MSFNPHFSDSNVCSVTIDSIIEGVLNQTSFTSLRITTDSNTWSLWFRGVAKVLETNKCLEDLLMWNNGDGEPHEDDKAAFSEFLTELKKNTTLKKVILHGFQVLGVPIFWIERKNQP